MMIKERGVYPNTAYLELKTRRFRLKNKTYSNCCCFYYGTTRLLRRRSLAFVPSLKKKIKEFQQ